MEVLSHCMCLVPRLVDSCCLSSCLNFCILHVVGFLFQFLLQLLEVGDIGLELSILLGFVIVLAADLIKDLVGCCEFLLDLSVFFSSPVGLVSNETYLDAGLLLNSFLALLFDGFPFLVPFLVCTDTLLFPFSFHFGASFVELALDR